MSLSNIFTDIGFEDLNEYGKEDLLHMFNNPDQKEVGNLLEKNEKREKSASKSEKYKNFISSKRQLYLDLLGNKKKIFRYLFLKKLIRSGYYDFFFSFPKDLRNEIVKFIEHDPIIVDIVEKQFKFTNFEISHRLKLYATAFEDVTNLGIKIVNKSTIQGADDIKKNNTLQAYFETLYRELEKIDYNLDDYSIIKKLIEARKIALASIDDVTGILIYYKRLPEVLHNFYYDDNKEDVFFKEHGRINSIDSARRQKNKEFDDKIKKTLDELNIFVNMDGLELIYHKYFRKIFSSYSNFVGYSIGIVVNISVLIFLSLTLPFIIKAFKAAKAVKAKREIKKLKKK